MPLPESRHDAARDERHRPPLHRDPPRHVHRDRVHPGRLPPLTLYGVGGGPRVRLEFTVDATITPAAWAALVTPTAGTPKGNPAWAMFQSCATKTSARPACAPPSSGPEHRPAAQAPDDHQHAAGHSRPGHAQALALRTDADRTQLEDMRLISRQDTFLANAGRRRPDRPRIGAGQLPRGRHGLRLRRASAVFTNTRFHLVSTRKSSGGVIFAPNSAPNYPYGFLVTPVLITADRGLPGGADRLPGPRLGPGRGLGPRIPAWDHPERATRDPGQPARAPASTRRSPGRRRRPPRGPSRPASTPAGTSTTSTSTGSGSTGNRGPSAVVS